MQIDLTNKVALVTGAAHGFGRAISMALCRCGTIVWAADLLAEELAETAALGAQAGARCIAAPCDVTSSTAAGALVEQIAAAEGRIDILVNNAGGVVGQVGRPIDEVGDGDWDAVVRANLYSAFYCIRAVVPVMKRQR